ncbi:MAG: hypothetical protein GX275_00170 [Clostridiales bacterium]|nr:hypothetical protein [Clostridiales bacterium]
MKVINQIIKTQTIQEIEVKYIYRISESKFEGKKVYGIEIEKNEIVNGKTINVDREFVEKISPNMNKIEKIYNVLVENIVSPIHFIDIMGEEIDKCVFDFN